MQLDKIKIQLAIEIFNVILTENSPNKIFKFVMVRIYDNFLHNSCYTVLMSTGYHHFYNM